MMNIDEKLEKLVLNEKLYYVTKGGQKIHVFGMLSIEDIKPLIKDIVEEQKRCVDRIWNDCFDSELDFSVEQMNIISSAISAAKIDIETSVSIQNQK